MDHVLDLQLLQTDLGAEAGITTDHSACSATSCCFAIDDGFVEHME